MAGANRRFVVNEKGKKESVLLPVKEYEELIEDLKDLTVIAERRDEPTKPLEVVKERLEKKWRSTASR
ncbi:MAG: hypothetical protein IH956_01210 [Chloroflexi bacterium]|nr:hypothetical protein [Chloroflexota bacterium]